ncbi:MAG: DNA repair protein RecO [Defluviitaleaceae bacterium]|nr:DNA repair protein RecO [Defluviitaleaceae bacterium]MCL2837368.1 DNA repair protein RecO [Defluviitaleaceae bacterium]
MAGTFKDKGLVIKEWAAGENDKRLLLLLFERGRTAVFARGAGKPKSKFHACAQTFAFGEYLFYEGAGFLSVAQCELMQNFYGVRRDFDRLCLASHVLEMAERMILPGMPCQNELRLIYLALQRLSETDYPPRLAAVVFELKFLQMEGFCDRLLPGITLSAQAGKAVEWVLESGLKDIFSFNLPEKTVLELSGALDMFRRGILDSPPRSINLLNS